MTQSKTISYLALGVGLILLIPLALQLTIGTGVDGQGFNWTVSDFVIAGVLLFGSGLAYVFVAGRGKTNTYRAAVGIAVMTTLLLMWANGAVGILGSEDNPVNVLYLGVPLVGLIGLVLSRFRPHGMALTLCAMAVAIALVPVIAYIINRPLITPTELTVVAGIHLFFIAPYVASALLFRHTSPTRQGPTAE